MAKTETQVWDAAEYLNSKEDITAYLEAILEEGDPALIPIALNDIARSKGMDQISHDTSLSRENLQQVITLSGNPEMGAVLNVLRILGLRFQITPLEDEQAA